MLSDLTDSMTNLVKSLSDCELLSRVEVTCCEPITLSKSAASDTKAGEISERAH